MLMIVGLFRSRSHHCKTTYIYVGNWSLMYQPKYFWQSRSGRQTTNAEQMTQPVAINGKKYPSVASDNNPENQSTLQGWENHIVGSETFETVKNRKDKIYT